MEKSSNQNLENLSPKYLTMQIKEIKNFNLKTSELTQQYMSQIEILKQEIISQDNQIASFFNTLENNKVI